MKPEDQIVEMNEVLSAPVALLRGDGLTKNNSDIALFDGLKNQPRGTIENRSTLLREVKTRTAGLVEDNRDLDDLALQFDGTEAGLQFISAWKQAAIIVDADHGPGYGIPTPVTPPTP